MSETNANLTHHFLIAMPAMTDPTFSRTLIYVADHSEHGALGLIINRPIDMNFAALFERIDLPLHDESRIHQSIYFGGPVQTDRGFVLHRPQGQWVSSIAVNDELALTSSRDILQAVGTEDEPSDLMITLGYTGWTAGQLEYELRENAWLTVAADTTIIFNLPPEERLAAAMQKLGVTFTNLSDTAGHA